MQDEVGWSNSLLSFVARRCLSSHDPVLRPVRFQERVRHGDHRTGLRSAAYQSQIFLGAFQSVDDGQLEASRAVACPGSKRFGTSSSRRRCAGAFRASRTSFYRPQDTSIAIVIGIGELLTTSGTSRRPQRLRHSRFLAVSLVTSCDVRRNRRFRSGLTRANIRRRRFISTSCTVLRERKYGIRWPRDGSGRRDGPHRAQWCGKRRCFRSVARLTANQRRRVRHWEPVTGSRVTNRPAGWCFKSTTSFRTGMRSKTSRSGEKTRDGRC